MNIRRICLPALLLALVGCNGSDPSPTPAPPPDLGEGLKELAEVYKYRAAQRLRVPAKAADLSEHDGALPNAWPAIQEGQLVVVWRVGYAPGSTGVLAHGKDAPTQGGKVLLRNGTVKEMTADEFRAAKG